MRYNLTKQLLLQVLLPLCLFLCISCPDLQSGESTSQTTALFRNYHIDGTLLPNAIKIAHSQVGTRETGNNRGAVEKYQKSTGNRPGDPYCYSGIYYCFNEAAKIAKVPNPLKKTGLASAGRLHLDKTAMNARGINTPGLLFWQYPQQITGHVEISLSIARAGWVRCIGFNTGGSNARDGGGVEYTMRNINHPLSRMVIKRVINFSTS